MQKLKPKEERYLAQCQTTGKWWGQDTNSGSLTPKPTNYYTLTEGAELCSVQLQHEGVRLDFRKNFLLGRDVRSGSCI